MIGILSMSVNVIDYFSPLVHLSIPIEFKDSITQSCSQKLPELLLSSYCLS